MVTNKEVNTKSTYSGGRRSEKRIATLALTMESQWLKKQVISSNKWAYEYLWATDK